MLPFPFSPPRVLLPANQVTAPAPSVFRVELPSELVFAKTSVPALTSVSPVWRFVPLSVRVPLPALVRAPLVAVEAPEIVRLLVVTSIVLVVFAVSVKLRSVEVFAPV